LDPDPYWIQMLDPDPDEMNADPQPCIKHCFLIKIQAVKLIIDRGSKYRNNAFPRRDKKK
jgi:hypothetical protein